MHPNPSVLKSDKTLPWHQWEFCPGKGCRIGPMDVLLCIVRLSKCQSTDKGKRIVIFVTQERGSGDVITFKCTLVLHSAFPSQQTLFHLNNKMDITQSAVKCGYKQEQQPWSDSFIGAIHRLHWVWKAISEYRRKKGSFITEVIPTNLEIQIHTV